MPEANGSGRLDRIEALLDKLAERQREFQIIQEHDHEEFKQDHKQLMTWQVLMQEKMDRWDQNWEKSQAAAAKERERLDALSEKTDKRIADLVAAIGKLIERTPPVGNAQ